MNETLLSSSSKEAATKLSLNSRYNIKQKTQGQADTSLVGNNDVLKAAELVEIEQDE
jgi:hypothetical protein